MRGLVSKLPGWAKAPFRPFRPLAAALVYGGRERFCPVCGKSSKRFVSAGLEPRPDAQCPRCGAVERHRFVWLYLTRRTDLFDGAPKRVLHVAPEPCLEPRLRQRLGEGYLTADLMDSRAMVRMDVTDIRYPDRSFDVIYCSHVLEHVPDDRKALREFHRVLKDDGWAIILVPITAERTFEDPSIVLPSERLKAFGQTDHVRRYGPDYVDRLREAGFRVAITRVEEVANGAEAVRLGLTAASGEIFHCTR